MFAFIHRISILMPSLAIVVLVVMTTKRIQVRTYVHVLTHRFLTTLFIWSLYVDSYMNRSNTFTQTRWQISLFIPYNNRTKSTRDSKLQKKEKQQLPSFLVNRSEKEIFFPSCSSSCFFQSQPKITSIVCVRTCKMMIAIYSQSPKKQAWHKHV